jgi:hypothetical protein
MPAATRRLPAALTEVFHAQTAVRKVAKLLFNSSFPNHGAGLEDSHQPSQTAVNGCSMGLKEFHRQGVEPLNSLAFIGYANTTAMEPGQEWQQLIARQGHHWLSSSLHRL